MRRHHTSCGLLQKHKTIRRVIPHSVYGIKLLWYYGNKLNFYVRVRLTDTKDSCKGCDFKKLSRCGLVCGDYAEKNVLKRVHEGDTLVTEEGKTFVVKKDGGRLVVESTDER